MPSVKALALLAFALLIASGPVGAWSLKGHGKITLAVHQSLKHQSPAIAAEFLRYANTLHALYSSENPQQAKECRANASLCFFGQWPDLIRQETLKSLLPDPSSASLEPLLKGSSSTWHYHNRYYSVENNSFVTGCDESGELLRALTLLLQGFKNEASFRNRAVLLSFIVHLAEDAHQPLHTLSAVTKNCEHDRGGNTLCVKKSRGDCELNLHALWDHGAGLFYQQHDFVSDSIADGSLNTSAWINESSTFAAQVYANKKAFTSKEYQQSVQAISKERVERAVVNLQVLLLNLIVVP